MWIDATIAFGGIFLLAIVAFTLHWWLGRPETMARARELDRRDEEARKAKAAAK